jgi:hypothetical protein
VGRPILSRSTNPRLARLSPLWLWSLVALLLSLHFAIAVSAITDKTPTFDEPAHLLPGISFWMTNDNRLNPSSGRLPQALAGGVTYLLTPSDQLPVLQGPIWDGSKHEDLFQEIWFPAQQGWFFRHMVPGRMAICLLSVLTGLTVFLWSRSLWGDIPGLFGLTLYTFCPTMLANGALVTSDMAIGLFFTLSVCAAWRLVNRPTPLNIALTGIAAGAAAISKFSVPLLIPILFTLLLITLLRPRSRSRRSGGARTVSFLTSLAGLLMAAVVAWVFIWASYTFRYDALAPGQSPSHYIQTHWAQLQATPGLAPRLLGFLCDHKILPQAYLLGAHIIASSTTQRYAFFNGQVSYQGWFWFFPVSLAVKTPLATLAAMALAGILALKSLWGALAAQTRSPRLRKLRLTLYRTAPLWVLAIVYLAITIASRHNMGHRYMTPIYPALYILAASAATLWFHSKSLFRLIPIILAIALALESLLTWPNYIPYMNPLAGAPDQRYRLFVDSSLDWGQDLGPLKSWLDARGLQSDGGPPVYVSYFGQCTIAQYGIRGQQIFSFASPLSEPPDPQPWQPGIYCISATMLQSVFTQFPGEWTPQYQARYQLLEKALTQYTATPPQSFARQQLLAQYGRQHFLSLIAEYECARFTRLAAWLRQREPDAQVNHSILIYKVTDQDLAGAFD